MTTRRKRLPYAAMYLIDQALMELSELTRCLLNLTKANSIEEQLRLIAKVMDNAYKATLFLKEIEKEKDHE